MNKSYIFAGRSFVTLVDEAPRGFLPSDQTDTTIALDLLKKKKISANESLTSIYISRNTSFLSLSLCSRYKNDPDHVI